MTGFEPRRHTVKVWVLVALAIVAVLLLTSCVPARAQDRPALWIALGWLIMMLIAVWRAHRQRKEGS